MRVLILGVTGFAGGYLADELAGGGDEVWGAARARPDGSFSKAIYNPYLDELGGVRYGRQDPQPDRGTLLSFWRASREKLSRPPYFIDDRTRPIVAPPADPAHGWRSACRISPEPALRGSGETIMSKFTSWMMMTLIAGAALAVTAGMAAAD